MAKELNKININLAFNADTSKAKAQMQELQSELQKLMSFTNSKGKPLALSDDISKATLAAGQLKQMLTSATNVDTGKLDLGKFSSQMKQSGLDLKYFRDTFKTLGPQGEKTFLNLTKAISSADFTISRTKGLVNELYVTLKNAARWQFSSSVLHGFMGTIQSAYGYAQSLNESLNNIRIVTGQSVEQMDKFAERANRAAKALSATTTEYTNAALIFYQQGLDDSEVEERTNTVIKMAHAANESAKDVSSYMTAIWNNYADGSKELEYYGDVITTLGAKTAASSSEIAEGLEKFASIGQTIGLNYEYASAVVATIVDKTRQSADVVGTAFKTIFSRLQGLQLGETLDDGTTLNKYSKALLAVGIDIKDANGELKDMNDILDEMGSKWKTLHRDEQMALAQTVAGVRQYTQLVSLMNNYDDFKTNVFSAENSSGSLTEQANIYAESWEAAKDRVRTATEELWTNILDDDFFIFLLNGFEKLISGVSLFTESIGGIPGIISTIGVVASTVFEKQLATTFNNLQMDISSMLGNEDKLRAQAEAMTQEILSSRTEVNEDVYDVASRKAELDIQTEQSKLREEMLVNSKSLSDKELEVVQILMEQNEQLAEQVRQQAKLQDNARLEGQDIFEDLIFDIKVLPEGANFEEIQKEMEEMAKTGETSMLAYRKALEESTVGGKNFKQALTDGNITGSKQDTIIKKLCETYKKMGEAVKNGKQAQENFSAASKKTADTIKNGIPQLNDFGTTVVKAVSTVSSFSMALNSLNGIWSTLENPDLSPFEKFFSLITSVSMVIPSLSHGLKSYNETIQGTALYTNILNTLNVEQEARTYKNIAATLAQYEVEQARLTQEGAQKTIEERALSRKYLLIAAEKLGIEVSEDATEEDIRGLIIKEAQLDTTKKYTTKTLLSALAEKLNEKATEGTNKEKSKNIVLTLSQTLANHGLNASMAPILAITILITAAMASLAVIIWATVNAVQAISAAYNKDAIAAENAATAAKNLAEAFNEAKEEYNSLIQTMEEYKTARDSLDKLTVGTQEYEEALIKANEAALELIETGNLVRGEDYDITNGEIIIEKKSLEDAKREKFSQMQSANAASIMAQAGASKAKAKANQTDLVREDDNTQLATYMAAMTTSGAAIGLIGGPIGVAIGSAIGAATGGLMGAAINTEANKEENERIDKLTKLYDDIGEAAFDQNELIDLGFDTASKEYIESVKKIVKANVEAAEQVDLASELAASAVLKQSESFVKSDNQDKITKLGGDIYNKIYQDSLDDYRKKTTNDDWFGIGSEENIDAMEKYAEAAELSKLNGYKVTNFKRGGNVEYEYIDENNKRQVKEVTQEEIAAKLAEVEASKKLEEQTNNLVKIFNGLENSANLYDKAIADFLGGDLNNSTKNEFNSLAGALGNAGITFDSSGYIETNQQDKLATYFEDHYGTQLEALGLDPVEYARQFYGEFNRTLKGWKSIEIPGAFEDLNIELSQNLAQKLENVFSDLKIGPKGKEVADEFAKFFTDNLKGLDFEDQQKAFESLLAIDWSDWDALEQAKDIFEEFDVEIDDSSEAWKEFVDKMRKAAGATPDYSQLQETLQSISTIINDLDFGSIIKDEDYKKLLEYNDEWERFFLLQSDGSRKFIGNKDNFQKALVEGTRNELGAARNRLEVQQDFNSRNTTDFSSLIGTGDQSAAKNIAYFEKDLLKLLGYDMFEILDNLYNKEYLDELYKNIDNFVKENITTNIDDLQQQMASTANTIPELNDLYASGDLGEGDVATENYQKQLEVLGQQALSTAKSLQDLKNIQGAFNEAAEGAQITEDAYREKLIQIAEGYENCAKEVLAYKAALASGNSDSIAQAEDEVEASILLAEAAEEYGLEVQALERQSKQLRAEQKVDAKTAANLVVQNQRMNKGVVSLSESFKKWKKALDPAQKLTGDYAEAVVDCTEAIADLVGASKNLELPEDFFNVENMSLLEQAAQGDIEAINNLGIAVAQAQLDMLEFNATGLNLAMIKSGEEINSGDLIRFDDFIDNINFVKGELSNLRTAADSESQAMSKEWVERMNEIALATGMSVDEMNGMLNSMGVQAKVEVVHKQMETWVPTYTEVTEPTEYQGDVEGGQAFKHYTIPGDPIPVTGSVAIAQISTEDNPLTLDINEKEQPATYVPSGRGAFSPSTSTAIKKQKNKNPTKIDKDQYKKKDEEIERYHEINNELEFIADNLDDIAKKKDRAFGKDKIRLIEQETEAYKKQLEAQEQKLKEIQTDLSLDQQIIVTKYGASINKETGEIDNYDEIFAKEINRYNKGYRAYIASLQAAENAFYDSAQEDSDQEVFDKAKEAAEETFKAVEKRYETFTSEVGLYEKTVDLSRQQKKEIQEIKDTIQDLGYEKLQQEIELRIIVNDNELKKLDYYIQKYSGDFYTYAEMIGRSIEKLQQKLGPTGMLENYKNSYNWAQELRENNGISDQDYYKTLQDAYTGIYDELSALDEEDLAFMNYYSDAIAKGSEELDVYTEKMSNLTGVVDHYNNLVSLLHGEENYDAIGIVLEGKTKTVKNELDAAVAEFQMADGLAKSLEEQLKNTDIQGRERELLESNYKAVKQYADDTHEIMLSKTEEWVEAEQALLQNNLNKTYKQLESQMTNGAGFDYLNGTIERLKAINDINYTGANQFYETQTMINNIQKEIDKTSNTAAKQRLKNFQEEFKNLQKLDKLSKAQLEIKKAEYEVELAKIALEEAQNAKTTVRLQRDNEGNFGYVYTADQNLVADAEQKLLDAENALYNTRYETAENSATKILKLQEDLTNELIKIDQDYANGTIATEEERDKRKNEIIQQYTDTFKLLSQDYALATENDADDVEYYWTTAYDGISRDATATEGETKLTFKDMVSQVDEWETSVKNNATEASTHLDGYKSKVSSTTTAIGIDLGKQATNYDGLKKDIGKVVTESDNLKQKIGDVILKQKDEYDQIGEQLLKYGEWRNGIDDVRDSYTSLADEIQNAINKFIDLKKEAIDELPKVPDPSSGNTGNKDNSNNANSSSGYNSSSGGTANTNNKSLGNEKSALATRVQELIDDINYNRLGVPDPYTMSWISYAYKAGYSASEIDSAQSALNKSIPVGGSQYDYEKAKNIASKFKSGGFTGAWGPEGRLAVLHEKELILNKQDTENFLIATDILRNVVKLIDINSLNNQISHLSSISTQAAENRALEQSVSIEAHFPNVSDRNEIEEAFNNLINTASQYANRKI